jgi:hypothetical protein
MESLNLPFTTDLRTLDVRLNGILVGPKKKNNFAWKKVINVENETFCVKIVLL